MSQMDEENVCSNLILYTNKELLNMIISFNLQNGQLKRNVEELKQEVCEIKSRVKATDSNNHSKTKYTKQSGQAMIVELSKRIRELTASLESAKMKLKQANGNISDMKKQRVEKSNSSKQNIKVDPLIEESLLSDDPIKFMNDKIGEINSKLSDQSEERCKLKEEMELATKILKEEIGQNFQLKDLNTLPSTQRMRSQEILKLQKQFTELQQRINENKAGSAWNCFIPKEKKLLCKIGGEKPLNDVASKDACTQDLESVSAQVRNSKQKLKSLRCENIQLELTCDDLKQKLKLLTEKDGHDQELIAAFQANIQATESNGTEEAKKIEEQVKVIEREIEQHKRELIIKKEKVRLLENKAYESRLHILSSHADCNRSVKSGNHICDEISSECSSTTKLNPNLLSPNAMDIVQTTNEQDNDSTTVFQMFDEALSSTTATAPTAENTINSRDGSKEIGHVMEEIRKLKPLYEFEREELVRLTAYINQILEEENQVLEQLKTSICTEEERNNKLLQKLKQLKDKSRSKVKINATETSVSNSGCSVSTESMPENLLIKQKEIEALQNEIEHDLRTHTSLLNKTHQEIMNKIKYLSQKNPY